MRKVGWKSLVGIAIMVMPACVAAPTLSHPSATPPAVREARDPMSVAEAFANALATGDEATVRSLLAEDVVIYESGGQESSREEYMSHHMKSDMAFLAAVKIQVLERRHGGSDEVAWVITRSRLRGAHEGKAVDLYSTESLVLTRSSGVFRIAHVHWSSRPAKTAPSST